MNVADEQKNLLSIVKNWRINEAPEYRGFRCGYCQTYINEAWFHWLSSGGYHLPLHLCDKTCEQLFKKGQLQISVIKKPHPVKNTTKKGYTYPPQTVKRLFEIVSSWDKNKKTQKKIFICDECEQVLAIDTADNLRKGYHVWWKMNDETLAELHFHKKCALFLQIIP